jgi:hypothetical protein
MLVVSYSPKPGDEDAFNEWYQAERIPALLKVPGIAGATTYVATEDWVREEGGGLVPITPPPNFMTVYGLTDVDAVKTEAYLDATNRTYGETYPTVDGRQLEVKRNFTVVAKGISRMDNPPFELTEGARRGLLFVSLTPEAAWEEKTHEWYDTIHLHELLVCPGFIGTHRYRAIEGIPNLLALYDLDSVNTLKTPEFKASSGRSYDQLPPLAREVAPHRTRNMSMTFEEIFHTGLRLPH